jgi:hypothetical protein
MTLFMIVLLLASPGVAQAKRVAMTFLLTNPGVRASAMGGAFSAIADDATATYYNPAGLAQIENGAIHAFRHTFWRQLYQHQALALRLGRGGVLAFSHTSEGEGSDREEAKALSFASDILTWGEAETAASVGISAKVVGSKARAEVGAIEADVRAVDIGFLIRNLWPNATLRRQDAEPQWIPDLLRPRTRYEEVDIIMLHDGTEVVGLIVEEVPGVELILEIEKGRVIIGLDRVSRIRRHETRTVTPKPGRIRTALFAHRPSGGVSVGAGLFNLGGDVEYINDGVKAVDFETMSLPRYVRLGIAYVPVDTPEFTVLCLFDVTRPLFDGYSTNVHAGLEIVLGPFLTLRIGRQVDPGGRLERNTFGLAVGSPTIQMGYRSGREDGSSEGMGQWGLTAHF